MSAHEAIRRLLAIYGQLLDSHRLDDWGGLFTPDAVFRVYGNAIEGREAIMKEIGGMQPPANLPVKHGTLAPVIDLLDDDHARVWTDLVAFGTTEDGSIGTATIARYHDRVERGDDGRWRFRERVIVMGGEDVPDGVAPTPAY